MNDISSEIERLRKNVVLAESVAVADVDLVNALVQKDAFAVVRGVFDSDEMEVVRENIIAGFDSERDQPSIGEHPSVLLNNYQKMTIGGQVNHWDYRPRFMRTMYSPMWAPDIYGMRATFWKVAQLRNRLQGKPVDYAIAGVEDNLWTASRLQHYPAGGGNISRHRDAVLQTVTEASGVTAFYQILLLITSKGKHFEDGGAFIELNGDLVNLEDEFKAGDVVIYDGGTMHGVHEIDPHKVPSLNTLDGRLVALVSLYKDMFGAAKSYEGFENTFVDANLPPEQS